MVIPLLKYRRLIWERAVSDLRHRYAGTGMGVVWNVLHPLALIGVYSVVFSTVFPPPAGKEGDRFWYPLYLCSGLLPWLAFAECVTRSAGAFVDNAPYLKKLPIPEPVFVAQAAVSATLGLGITFSLLLAVALATGHRPTAWWLLLPVPLVLLQALGFGVGLLCGTLNVFFRDVGQVLTVALQVVMWTVPIVYLANGVKSPGLLAVLRWHPIMPPLAAVRSLFIDGRPPAAWVWVGMVAWPAAAIAAAGAVFRQLRVEIRDVL
jgi:ABC-type polysaccharide/polyol phosphate export permease